MIIADKLSTGGGSIPNILSHQITMRKSSTTGEVTTISLSGVYYDANITTLEDSGSASSWSMTDNNELTYTGPDINVRVSGFVTLSRSGGSGNKDMEVTVQLNGSPANTDPTRNNMDDRRAIPFSMRLEITSGDVLVLGIKNNADTTNASIFSAVVDVDKIS